MATLLTQPKAPATPTPAFAPPAPPPPVEKPARLVSLDAYRGFIMLTMASSGLAFGTVARTLFPANEPPLVDERWRPLWDFLRFQTDHVAWVGCSFWDLIQPSFMFMVGVAIPYSYASRKARGESEGWIMVHTVWRALLLILLGVFLTSNGRSETIWEFPNVLCQIGLGYTFVYLLRGRGLAVQLAALAVMLAGVWALFTLWPLPASDFDYAAVGLKNWNEWLPDFPHWNKNTNAAAVIDWWFLNLFPRTKPFEFNAGGYQTLNFVPSMATMLLGLMAGELLRGPRSRLAKVGILIAAGAICLALGLAAGETVSPIVKRIWTPSWALYSSGWTFLMLAAFYLVIDVWGWKGWAFPLVVVGMNSIAMYCMAQLLPAWIGTTLKIHLGPALFAGLYGPIVLRVAILFVLWLVCWWMYRRGLFLRI
jgi:predicted acyltransferase